MSRAAAFETMMTGLGYFPVDSDDELPADTATFELRFRGAQLEQERLYAVNHLHVYLVYPEGDNPNQDLRDRTQAILTQLVQVSGDRIIEVEVQDDDDEIVFSFVDLRDRLG